MKQDELRNIAKEADPRDSLTKKLFSDFTFKLTDSYPKNNKFKIDKPLIVFKPSQVIKYSSIVVVIFLWTILIYGISVQKNFSVAAVLLGGLAILIVTINFVNNAFYKRNILFKIYVDKEGIQFDTTLHKWQTIENTVIANYSEGKTQIILLIIVSKDSNYNTYNLQNYTSRQIKEIANCIEHYKQS
ncbi:MAG: hypothetical protein ACOVO1_05090 [Chitinophagaceae bacterium]